MSSTDRLWTSQDQVGWHDLLAPIINQAGVIMAFGKTQEQKDEEARQQAAKAHAESPIGRAEAARERGDLFFQIEVEINSVSGASGFGSSTARVRRHGGRPDLLGQIEEIGWRLEHVGYVFIETGSTSTNRAFGTGQGVVVKGFTQGIYLFRNTGNALDAV